MEAYRHVDVVGGPHEVAISPDGKRAIVTNYNKQPGGPQKTLSLISLPDGETIRTIDLGEFSMPHDVQWVNDRQVVHSRNKVWPLVLTPRHGESVA